MRVKIELLSNTIFGSGKSVPGGEDISVLTDKKGYPYLRASTFKGILREEIENILDWEEKADKNHILTELFGKGGETREHTGKLIFSDFRVSENIKVFLDRENMTKEEITDCFTGTYTFTSLEDGVSKKGYLRRCRYINKGIIFYGNIECDDTYKELIKTGLKAVKYMGTMRSRGFGEVKVEEVTT